MTDEFIGAGWAFPLRTDSSGGIALVSKGREIEEAIRLILGTAPGERPMRPEFGCRIHDEVFAGAERRRGRPDCPARARRSPALGAPNRGDRRGRERRRGADRSVLYIEITYSVKATNDRRNLVFPFYTIPEEAE